MSRENAEHGRCHAGFRLHACPDERDLRNIRIEIEAARSDIDARSLGNRSRLFHLGLRDREADVRYAFHRDVLNNHVDVHPGLGERLE